MAVLAGAGYAAFTMIQNRPIPETRVVEVQLPLVETMEVEYSNVRLRVRAEGTVAPRTETELVPEVSGRVMEISQSLAVGGFFEEGDVLLQLDSREYEFAGTRSPAAIAQGELRLETERQEAAVAMEEWELLGAGRPTPLAMREPQIAEAEASLASAEANLQQAEYDLERTIVRAPFAGRVRSKRVDVGQRMPTGPPWNDGSGEVVIEMGVECSGDMRVEIVTSAAFGVAQGKPAIHDNAIAGRELRGKIVNRDQGRVVHRGIVLH